MAYGDYEDLPRQLPIKYYVIKHLILLKIQIMMNINVDFLQWLKILKKDFCARHKGTGINSDIVFENQQLGEELHKSFIRKLA